MKLTNKTIIITGSSDGIGKQTALKLAKENTKLALIARDKNKLLKVCKEVSELGSEAKAYPCNLKDSKQIEETVKKILSDFGK